MKFFWFFVTTSCIMQIIITTNLLKNSKEKGFFLLYGIFFQTFWIQKAKIMDYKDSEKNLSVRWFSNNWSSFYPKTSLLFLHEKIGHDIKFTYYLTLVPNSKMVLRRQTISAWNLPNSQKAKSTLSSDYRKMKFTTSLSNCLINQQRSVLR